MKYSSKILRSCFHSLIYIVVSLLVLAAILLSVARLMLPAIEEYKPDIELWISDAIGQQIEIATLDAAWYGFEPQLVLKGVQLLSADRTETFGYFQRARIGLNVIGSIYERRIKPGGLTIEGAHLSVIRHQDGNISISGLENNSPQKKTTRNNQILADWLFNQRILDIKNSELIWQDHTTPNKSWHFSEANLQFRNDGEHHIINGSVKLPEALGARIEVAIDARGNLLAAKGWSGTGYVEGANLKLFQWLEKSPDFNATISDGMIGLRLWGQWRKAKLSSLRGEIFSNGFKVSSEKTSKIQVIESFSTNFLVQKINKIWEATFDEIVISTARKVWPQIRVDALIDVENKSIEAEASYVDIADVLPMVKLFYDKQSKVSKMLSKLKPAGIISNISLTAKQNSKNDLQYYVQGQLSQFRNKPSGKIPGIKTLNARFFLNNSSMKAIIPHQNLTLDYPGVFEYVSELKKVEGEIYWQKMKNGGSQFIAQNISANYLDANVKGSLKIGFHQNKKPNLDLAFYFTGGRVKNAKYYIPSRLMNKAAVNWVKSALKAGKVKDGGLLYYGNIKKYPFLGSEGLFDLSLNIENGTLLFAKKWPKISKINGEFTLAANSLHFFSSSARTKNLRLQQVNVDFPAFRTSNRELHITGKIDGRSETKIDYLHNSPLEKIFAQNIAPLKLEGESTLDLSLTVPLSNVEKTKVSGMLSVVNNKLIAEEWKLKLNDVSTDMVFNNQGITAQTLSGTMNGIKFEGKINTEDAGDNSYREIIIRGEGDVDKKGITYLLKNFIDNGHWGNYISGTSKIKTKISIPIFYEHKKFTPKIHFNLDADFENIAISLPYPLNKTGGDKDTLSLDVELTGDKRLLKIKTKTLNSLFEIISVNDEQIITRGGIGFQQEAEMPAENGYRFIGHLDRFSWTNWEPILFPAEGEIPLLSSGGESGSQYFNVQLDRLELYGSWFGSTSVQASSSSQLWLIHLRGEELAGEVFIPVVLSSAPLVINMEKLNIVRSEIIDGEDPMIYLDPRSMPEIKINAKNFSYNDINFGHLIANAKKIENGLYLDTFSMTNEYTEITAKGNWVEEKKIQTSTFDILVSTKDLGKTVKSWKFSDAFGGGNGSLNIKATWKNKPSDFSFETAKGKVFINIKDASLLNFELGAAKMVGLFLPRRLLLDFRDVFKKGMSFDLIKGEYQIEDGNAFTTDLKLEGPAADILMAGRIGLAAEDYDQLVTVNRRLVGDSLSTLVALATNPLVNPFLAAQVFALKKLFENQIDEILSVQYTIKGPWKSPKITPVVKNLEDRGESIEDLFEN